mmetsp:Transcript_46065/g.121710  ORF Transcript_46065/g.121710 Transcript_46065/m.121710 type:complete len:257 (-) Transcript_46065:173-943(-)
MIPVEQDTKPKDRRPCCYALGETVLCTADGLRKGEGRILVTSKDRKEHLRTLEGHTGRVTCLVAERGEGGALFSGSVDGTIRKWDVSSGALLATLQIPLPMTAALLAQHEAESQVENPSPRDMVTCFVLHEEGKNLFSGHGSGTVRRWDVATGELLATIEGHKLIVTCLAISEGEKVLFSSSGDKSVKRWDLETGALIATLEGGHKAPVTALSVVESESVLYTGEMGEHTVHKWNLKTGEHISMEEGPPQVTYIEA